MLTLLLFFSLGSIRPSNLPPSRPKPTAGEYQAPKCRKYAPPQVACLLLAQKNLHFSVTSACEFTTETPEAQNLVCATEGGIQRNMFRSRQIIRRTGNPNILLPILTIWFREQTSPLHEVRPQKATKLLEYGTLVDNSKLWNSNNCF